LVSNKALITAEKEPR